MTSENKPQIRLELSETGGLTSGTSRILVEGDLLTTSDEHFKQPPMERKLSPEEVEEIGSLVNKLEGVQFFEYYPGAFGLDHLVTTALDITRKEPLFSAKIEARTNPHREIPIPPEVSAIISFLRNLSRMRYSELSY